MGGIAATESASRVVTAADARREFGTVLERSSLERLAVMLLDAGQRVIELWLLPGGANFVGLSVRDIVGTALRKEAAGLIVAHSHPSGDPTPSSADVVATRRLAAAARIAGLTLHDHLIFAGPRCTSMRVAGLL